MYPEPCQTCKNEAFHKMLNTRIHNVSFGPYIRRVFFRTIKCRLKTQIRSEGTVARLSIAAEFLI